MTSTNLPPYGFFPAGYEDRGKVMQPMFDWKKSLTDPSERQQSFLLWREEMRNTLANTIWPFFDRSKHQWQGQAQLFADALTDIEIRIMIEQLQGEKSKLEISADLCRETNYGTTHLDQFQAEDHPDIIAGANLDNYVCSITEDQIEDALAEIRNAYITKLTGLFWLKREFLRPRPYQAALLLEYDSFHSERALSATHSSFYSGHCLEGIIFCAAVAETWMENSSTIDESAVQDLARYAVDFGDRRVFAGVHYPSDNIASWVLALKLIPNIFDNPLRITAFVKKAIKEHSQVYQLISNEYVQHEIFEPALELLNEAFDTPPAPT